MSLDALVRNRHDRTEDHQGDDEALNVVLASLISVDLPAGMSLEDALVWIESAITTLEGQ